jgi:hypothetical protein
MISLPNNLAGIVNKINNQIIRNYTDIGSDLLPYFLANGRAFYDNLFKPAIVNEVKAEKGRESKAKNLQDIIDVSTIREVDYHY